MRKTSRECKDLRKICSLINLVCKGLADGKWWFGRSILAVNFVMNIEIKNDNFGRRKFRDEGIYCWRKHYIKCRRRINKYSIWNCRKTYRKVYTKNVRFVLLKREYSCARAVVPVTSVDASTSAEEVRNIKYHFWWYWTDLDLC